MDIISLSFIILPFFQTNDFSSHAKVLLKFILSNFYFLSNNLFLTCFINHGKLLSNINVSDILRLFCYEGTKEKPLPFFSFSFVFFVLLSSRCDVFVAYYLPAHSIIRSMNSSTLNPEWRKGRKFQTISLSLLYLMVSLMGIYERCMKA